MCETKRELCKRPLESLGNQLPFNQRAEGSTPSGLTNEIKPAVEIYLVTVAGVDWLHFISQLIWQCSESLALLIESHCGAQAARHC